MSAYAIALRTTGLALALCLGSPAFAQAPVQASAAAPIERRDPAVDAGSQWIGRALFLRCFCADNKLSFDAQGHLQGAAKTTDWTLAGFNLQKVQRKSPGQIELEGVRVAIRYAPDRHEFDRKPQNDETIKIAVADTGDARALERALEAVFAVGIDRPLQLAMPDYWKHYFDSSLQWPPDMLSGLAMENFAVPDPSAESRVAPRIAHEVDPGYSSLATHDRVGGEVRLRLVVDTDGVARRIAIVQPLGYGLDAKAAEALARSRFAPGTVQGKPVASQVLLNQEFTVVPAPR